MSGGNSDTSNKPTVRVAAARDEDFLTEYDGHVRPEVLGRVISAGQVLVVQDEGALLGWLRWSLFWDEVPFMNMVYVLEEHRGRGLGGALIDTWETQVGDDGHGLVMTSTQADEEAQHLYRKRGYVDCGVLLLPGEAAEVIFRKELTRGESFRQCRASDSV